MSPHTIFALASGKGGVGKTTSTVNLGAALVDAGHTVAMIDTDLGMANLASVLGLEVTGPTLHEVLAGEATIKEATYKSDRIAVIPSGPTLEGFAEADPARLREVVTTLSNVFDYVLLDVGGGLSHDTVLPLGLADGVILISTPDTPSFENALKTSEITEKLGGTVVGLVLTRVPAANPPQLELLPPDLDIPLLALIPEDEAVPQSVEECVPVVTFDRDSLAARGYIGLAAALDGNLSDAIPVVPTPNLDSDTSPGDDRPTIEKMPTDSAVDLDDEVDEGVDDSDGDDTITDESATFDRDEPTPAFDESSIELESEDESEVKAPPATDPETDGVTIDTKPSTDDGDELEGITLRDEPESSEVKDTSDLIDPDSIQDDERTDDESHPSVQDDPDEADDDVSTQDDGTPANTDPSPDEEKDRSGDDESTASESDDDSDVGEGDGADGSDEPDDNGDEPDEPKRKGLFGRLFGR